MPLSRNTRLLLLSLILLLGATTRVVNIDQQSLWVDEGLAYYHATHPDLVLSLSRDTHPPLYFASLRGWIELTGHSELALRYFSVLPSMLSMALMFPLAKELVRARGSKAYQSVVPLLAVLLLALADAENFLSQEVRHYTWHVLLAMASTWAFLRWIRQPERRWLMLWIVFTTTLIYTHYIGAFTGVVQGLYALLFLRGKTRARALGALVLSALLLAPWLLIVGVEQIDNRGANWSIPPSLALLLDIGRRWFSQQWPLMIGLAILGTVTISYREKLRVQWRPLAPRALMVMWLVVPIVLTFVVNHWIPILAPRRLSQITPAVALLVAFGLGNLRQPARGFLVAVIVVYGVTTVDFYRPKPPWREVGEQTAHYVVPGDLVLTDIAGGDYQLQYYYRQMLPADVTMRSLKVWRDFEPETYAAGLPALLDAYDSIWLMHWSEEDRSAFDWLDRLGFVNTARLITEHYTAVNITTDLTVFRYDRPPQGMVAGYDNGMTLRQTAIYPDDLRVDLWWSADAPLTESYTTSVFLLDAGGRLVAQADSIPFDGGRPTPTWQTGEIIFESKRLALVEGMADLPPGRYAVGVQVYRWTADGTQRSLTLDGEQWTIVGEIVR